MRVLYVASDQRLPGATGGSVHVHEVSRALARRGHDVHAVVHENAGPDMAPSTRTTDATYTVQRIRWFPDLPYFRMRALPRVRALVDGLRPDVVIERYYNFGGEGVRAAVAANLPSLLEVNSPVVDHAGSWKALLDALAIARPMKRYRERLCRDASALIAPTAAIVPQFARSKTTEVTWGANTDEFLPEKRDEALRASWGATPDTCVVLFSGSHRPWHGVHVLEAAARELKRRPDILFVFAGGDERERAQGFHGIRLGKVPYADMPRVTASADLSAAPYDRSKLPSLALGFYWSPLKIFEALASGVPVLTLDIEPLNRIVRGGKEGRFFRENDPADLARVIEGMAATPAERLAMGRHARERAPLYSWDAHAAQIEGVLRAIVDGRAFAAGGAP